ncbi:hypothetical protein Pcinc_023789 [Petrolisthes cinctipes]|uniref:Uncharacterized protein n=1 Tax=Petrolisthes cinctipes TaxID=88211 RepID=A0AAE1KEM4_PETCI|nr:hypothetical protein Pcinc_044494 [Petrolisthes cinctipes]KAK3871042.1 hypothetical protein Pcinc_023789 [Petrolisthes cinctipes]
MPNLHLYQSPSNLSLLTLLPFPRSPSSLPLSLCCFPSLPLPLPRVPSSSHSIHHHLRQEDPLTVHPAFPSASVVSPPCYFPVSPPPPTASTSTTSGRKNP